MVTGKIQADKIQQQREQDQLVMKNAVSKELDRIIDTAKNNMHRLDQQKEAKEPSQIAKILETPADKMNLDLLARLTSSMAASNIDLSAGNLAGKVAAEMNQEIDMMFQNRPDTSDLVLKKEPVQSKSQAGVQSQKQRQESEESGKDVSSSRDKISLVKEYSAAYASCMVNAGGEIKRKLERSESELRKRGMSDGDISAIQGGVKNSFRSDLTKTIKEAFLRKLMTKGKNIDSIMASKNLNDALKMGSDLAGVDSKSFDGMKGLAKDQLAAARSEAKDFVLEELEVKLMEKILSGQTKELDNQLKELIVLAAKVGVNMQQFMMAWKKKKIDLGLFFMDPKLSAQLGMGGEEKRESRYDMDREEEKELLMNRLRALYMRRALKGDFLTKLDTGFKMRKLKNGLIKLGLTVDDFERVENEGYQVAKDKMLEMLKEALSERATLYDLAGPAFKLIEKRLKGIMSNLERLGGAVTVAEFENLRDSVNRRMYDMAIQELHSVDSTLRTRESKSLEKKRDQLIKLISRLKEESKIDGVDINPRHSELVRHGTEGIRIIRERA